MVIYGIYRKNLTKELDLNDEKCYIHEKKFFSAHVSWEQLLSIRAAKRAAQGT